MIKAAGEERKTYKRGIMTNRKFKKVICRDCGIEFEMLHVRKKKSRCDDCTAKYQIEWRRNRNKEIKEILEPLSHPVTSIHASNDYEIKGSEFI